MRSLFRSFGIREIVSCEFCFAVEFGERVLLYPIELVSIQTFPNNYKFGNQNLS